MKQVLYWGLTNIRRHRTKFSRPSVLVFWIYAALVSAYQYPALTEWVGAL